MENYNELLQLFHQERSKVSQDLLDVIKKKTKRLKELEDEINIDIDVLDYYNERFEKDYSKYQDALKHVHTHYPKFFKTYKISDLVYEIEQLDDDVHVAENIDMLVYKVISKYESNSLRFERKVEKVDDYDQNIANINTAKLSIISEGDYYKSKNNFDYSNVTFNVETFEDYFYVQANYTFSYKQNNELPF